SERTRAPPAHREAVGTRRECAPRTRIRNSRPADAGGCRIRTGADPLLRLAEGANQAAFQNLASCVEGSRRVMRLHLREPDVPPCAFLGIVALRVADPGEQSRL